MGEVDHSDPEGLPMRIQVIFNPMANHGQAKALMEQITQIGKQYGRLDLVSTVRPGHATELARAARDAGYDVVAAAGGDGTIHEIVNGLLADPGNPPALGIIPIGSGNDFAYGLNQDMDLEKAVHHLFDGQTRHIDIIKIENETGRSELVNNGLGIGFDATVSIQSQLITRVHGFAMYALAALRTIALYYQTPHLTMRFDDRPIEQDSLLVAVGNGPRIGGGFRLTPDAKVDDGLLDSCTVNPVNRFTMLYMLPLVMQGTHITSRHVKMRRSMSIEILSDMPLPIHVDGEIFAYPEDNVREVKLTVLPRVLPVISHS
jgi:YegS/Rv2252/BmrU family lipid kinase